jgi:hypothetical protein
MARHSIERGRHGTIEAGGQRLPTGLAGIEAGEQFTRTGRRSDVD